MGKCSCHKYKGGTQYWFTTRMVICSSYIRFGAFDCANDARRMLSSFTNVTLKKWACQYACRNMWNNSTKIRNNDPLYMPIGQWRSTILRVKRSFSIHLQMRERGFVNNIFITLQHLINMLRKTSCVGVVVRYIWNYFYPI